MAVIERPLAVEPDVRWIPTNDQLWPDVRITVSVSRQIPSNRERLVSAHNWSFNRGLYKRSLNE